MLAAIFLFAIIGSGPTKVDVAEINSVKNDRGGGFVQVILWRWQNGPDGHDHYVANWDTVKCYKVVRSRGRWEVTWRSSQGEYKRVLARTFKETGPMSIDPEIQDRKRIKPKYRWPYRLDL